MIQLGDVGFRIITDLPRPSEDAVRRLKGAPSAVAADVMGRFHFMDPGIRSRSGLPLCGPAVTVNARPADNLMVHKVLEIARPGDVVVVSTNGNVTSAVFGELLCHAALASELGGIVVDGAIRDVEELRRLGFPAFSRSVCPGGCDKDGPGEINVPVSCGNTVIMPGDVVVGDEDGVTVVPREIADIVAVRVEEHLEREKARIAEIRSGRVFRPSIDEHLRSRGIPV